MDYKAKVKIISSKGSVEAGEVLPSLSAKELAVLKKNNFIVATIVETKKDEKQIDDEGNNQSDKSNQDNLV